jgi:polar amino acid transport system substrate-binding protein
MNQLLLYGLPILSLVLITIAYAIKQYRTKAHLTNTTNHLFSLLSISKDAMMLLQEDNTIQYMNEAMSTLLQVGNNKKLLFESDMPNVYVKGVQKRFKDFIQDEYIAQKNELTYYPQVHIETRKLGKIAVDLYLGKMYSSSDKSHQYIIVIRDLREALREIASGERDPLTHLPNRTKAYQDYQILCSKHHLREKKVALMMVSIDDFLITQSLLGHEQADKTILAVTQALKQLSVLHHYHIYHLTYANFLLIFPSAASIDDLFHTARLVQDTITKLYENHKSAAYLTATVGIATSPESGSVTDLFRVAHQALIEARKYGVGNAHLHKETAVKHMYDESVLQHDIQYAIERNELMIFYQPIIDAKTRKVTAAEALMRWKHPEYGLIPPIVFIPLMEKTGFIVEAGRYLIHEVIHQQAKWKLFGFEEIVVSLNASMKEIETDDYIHYLTNQLKEFHVRPDTIKVEITESLAMNNPDKMFSTLARLRGAGVSLSLDDFGTGYTSFSYLTKIPANTLKIDKSFIDNILDDRKSQQVVHAIIEVGHALDMGIVAEGVETAKMAQMLIEFGCDYLQGFYFSKPVPVFEMQGRLRQKKDISGRNLHQEGAPFDTLSLHPL